MTTDPRTALLRAMLRIRGVEETLAGLYRDEQEMRTPTHFSIGQEATAVGVCAALERDDLVYSGHRCHAHYLAKGGDLLGMVGELYGKEIGCAHGRGGSVHLNDPAVGFVAATAILSETIAVATGSAWAFAMDGVPRVAVSFFGDGATEEGAFTEAVNFAVVQRVPVLFVCENNLYSTHTPLAVRQPTTSRIHERVATYGLPAVEVDGYDVFAVHTAAQEAVAWCRAGKGPYFLECMTYRWREHVGPLWDYDWGYRTKDEVDAWVARDSIQSAAATLLAEDVLTAADVECWRGEVQAEVDAAIAAAKAAPFPSVERLLDGAYG
jgi:TPP-dependent pyruvate/acetoin dehydrogenase alpha subunit